MEKALPEIRGSAECLQVGLTADIECKNLVLQLECPVPGNRGAICACAATRTNLALFRSLWAYSVEKLPCWKNADTSWNKRFVSAPLANNIFRTVHQRDSVPMKCPQLAKHRVFQQNRLTAAANAILN